MEITEQELAYIAGFVDGEGCITFKMSESNHMSLNYYYRPYVNISNTDKNVLLWINSIFPGNIRLSKRQNGNFKAGWQWILHSKKATSFVFKIYPYLRVKKKQAEIMIKMMNSPHATIEQADEMIRLNRRRIFDTVSKFKKKSK